MMPLAASLPVPGSAVQNTERLDWKAGLASRSITPESALWMAGFAARTKPSEGKLQELYVKALALDDGSKRAAVLVTADILGFPADLAQRIAERVKKKHGIARDRLILNASHTHSGPVVGDTLRVAYSMTETQWKAVRDYTAVLEDRVVECIGAALTQRKPARLRFGHSTASFATNRRKAINPNGPVDHDVPVLRIETENGTLLGVVFGYACHNTTLTADNLKFHGDYAGVAMAWLERRHPGLMALYVTGCGGDINPLPRGTLEHVNQYGEELGKAVAYALTQPLPPVNAPLRTAWAETDLAFAPTPDKAVWQERASSSDIYVQRHAKQMLEILEQQGKLPDTYPYPVQVWQFDSGLTLIPMAGEVVVDYALRLKRELGADRAWVAGYSNDVFAYVPSLRVLREGGYEGAGAMLYYGQPGAFAESVEETIVKKIHELVRKTTPRR